MVKKQLAEDLKKAVKDLDYQSSDVVLSISQNVLFGDYTSNIALQLAKQKSEDGKQSSIEIAKKISEKLESLNYLSKVEIKGPGFLNFFIKPEVLAQQVKEILEEGENFGKNQTGNGKKIQVEFVSANPTGPLTLANSRGGAIGDALANVLSWNGYQVEKEYYFNDSGNQVRTLGESVKAAAGKIPSAENHYQGEYVKDLAQKFQDDLELDSQELGHKLAVYLMENEIKPSLERFGLKYDRFYSEQSLYQGKIDIALELLKEKGVTYEKDGALWLKSSQFGDEKDRVLVTSEVARGRREPTYITPDIAYHIDTFSSGVDKKINVLGADHHGYVARLKAAMEAAGFGGRVEVILMQMVKLFKGSQEVRMSKRAGNFVTIDDLLEQIDKDAARFFFLMYSPDSQINFNLDLAKERSNKNPVFYVQYAHARTVNILAKAEKEVGAFEASLLTNKAELELIKTVSSFPDLVAEIGENYQVQKLPAFTIFLADLFHKFYESCRVLNAENAELKSARLGLVKAVKIVLANALGLMGIEAPERM